MILRVLMVVSAVTLASCSSLRPPQEQPAPVESRDLPTPPPVLPPPSSSLPSPPEPPPPVAPPEPKAPPAPRPATPASTLLASVDAAMAAGQLEQAAALCERALRISPRDGNLWYRLATIRYQQDRFTDAAGLARRALSFAGPDAKLAQDSQRLLQQAEGRD